MRETANTSAIILNRCAFRENDTRITLYSQDLGKLELVARGTKKLKSKLAGHLEPITFSEIMIVPGKQFDYIGTANSSDCFLNIKNDLEKLFLAGRAVKIFNKLIKEGEKDSKVFAVIFNFLNLLNKKNLQIKNYEFLYNLFVFKLLSGLGYGLNFLNCEKCRNKITDKSNFNYKKGEIICQKCSANQKSENFISISAECVNLLVSTSGEYCDTLTELTANENILGEYINVINIFFKYNF